MAMASAHIVRYQISETYSLVRKSVPGYALGFHSSHETDMGCEDGDPSERSENSDGGCKVVEDGQGVSRCDQVGKAHETSGKGECDVWDTSGCTSGEDLVVSIKFA